MSQEIRNVEEIDLGQVFNSLKRFGINILKGVFSIISFYSKKALLFLILLIVGVISGYFLDKQLKIDKEYRQEIILKPEYESTEHIYNYIESLQFILKDSTAIRSLNLTKSQAENIKSVTIEPIIVIEDIIDKLHEKYDDQSFHRSILNDYTKEDLKSKKLRSFYKSHRLIVSFKRIEDGNAKITETILQFLRSEEYFKNQIQLKIEQATLELEKNKTSLQFIDEFLLELNKKTSNDEKGIVIVADESKTPTIASLLKQKTVILNLIMQNKKVLELEKEMFSIVSDSGVVLENKSLYKRMIFLSPLALCGLFSLLYLIRYLFRTIKGIVNND